MGSGIWLPDGPLTRVFSLGAVPASTVPPLGGFRVNGLVPMGIYRAVPPALADGQAFELRLAADGSIPVTPSSAGGTLLQARIDLSLAGANVVLPAVALMRHRVRTLYFLTDTNVDIEIFSGATSLSGAMTWGVRQGLSFSDINSPFECGINEDFVLNLSVNAGVKGFVRYTTGV